MRTRLVLVIVILLLLINKGFSQENGNYFGIMKHTKVVNGVETILGVFNASIDISNGKIWINSGESLICKGLLSFKITKYDESRQVLIYNVTNFKKENLDRILWICKEEKAIGYVIFTYSDDGETLQEKYRIEHYRFQ